jgi:hypothetical protein
VARIHKDNLEILVNTILIHPVRVQDSQVSATPSDTLLSGTPETALKLHVDTLTDRLAVGCTWRINWMDIEVMYGSEAHPLGLVFYGYHDGRGHGR